MRKARRLRACTALAIVALATGAGSAAAHGAQKHHGAHTHHSRPARPADTVLRNGYVYTVDRHDSVKQAVAVRRGRIVYVGTNRGARRFIGRRTHVVNLHHKMLMPGIQDTHMHALSGGAALLQCDLHYAALTVEAFKAQIQSCLDATRDKEPDGWLEVVRWYRQAMLPSGAEVTKADLDALDTKRPIIVSSTDGHSSLGNSRALALAGITAATPDPPSGQIIHDGSGEPTGILEDRAQRLLSGAVPPPTAAERVESAKAALGALREQGVTAFMQQIATPDTIQAYETLARRGQLTVRASMGPDISVDEIAKPRAAVATLRSLRRRFDSGPLKPRAGIQVRNVSELFQDGVIQWPAQTASLLKPYLVNTGTEAHPHWVAGTKSGSDPYTPRAQLDPLVLAIAKAGFDPEIHAIGDRAVRHVLDTYAYVRKHLKGKDVRLQIAHAELVAPSDLARFKRLGVIPDMGFQWAKPAPDSIDAAKDYLGPARFNRMEPEGYFSRLGVPLTQGSDWPVDPLNEWFSMEVGITRKNTMPGAKYAGRLGKVPGVPLKGAIRAFTINGAYALHAEHETGSIERGKLADMIVLDQNLLKIPVSRISETKVLRTFVGGKTVYRAGR